MKTGDIVYGKYCGRYGQCKILSIFQVTKGILWWKKTIDVALVKFEIERTYYGWVLQEETVIKEIPVSELR